jgi:hypothetical protein
MPVIFISAKNDSVDAVKGEGEAGGVDYHLNKRKL